MLLKYKIGYRLHEAFGGAAANGTQRVQVGPLQQFCQFLLRICHIHPFRLLHLGGGGQLVFVAVLAQCGNAWKDDDGFLLLHGSDNGTNASMSHNETGAAEKPVEFVGRQQVYRIDMPGR